MAMSWLRGAGERRRGEIDRRCGGETHRIEGHQRSGETSVPDPKNWRNPRHWRFPWREGISVEAALARRGVGTRLYYPAFHHQGVFRDCGPFDPADYPNAVEYERTALSLPIFPTLSETEQDYVIASVHEALDEAQA